MNYLKLLFDLYLLKNNTKKSPEQIKKMQERKLRKILEYAYRNSVYYRRKFEACGITENNISNVPLERFPTTNKKQLLENFDELVTVPDLKQDELRRFDEEISADRKPFKGRYHVVHSSGSTGKPGYFVYDKQAWNSMLLGIIRAAMWDMTMPQILRFLAKGPRIVYIAATDGRYGGAMAVGDGIDGLRASQLFLDIKTPLSEWVGRINEFKPNMIIGYPSAIKILGELAENSGIDLNIFRIISCGEPLGAGLRNYLENVFDTDVINFYGASESLALGVESRPEEGMILFDDMNVIEVRNGNMYLTSLYNFAQPLIRYRLTDSISVQMPDGGSRYPFTKAVGLLGRTDDILWFEDKNGRREFLHPLAVEGICIEGLLDYQFRQLSKGAFEMLAEISENASESELCSKITKRMEKILDEKGLGYVDFHIIFVEKISPDVITGKKRLVVKNTERLEEAG